VRINSVLNSNWEKLINASNVFKQNVNNNYLKRLIQSVNTSEECSTSISDTLQSLNNFEDWSYQMYNSWGQFPPSGILGGTVTDFGDYDQCLSIKPNKVIGKSQYCLIDVSIPLPEPMPKHQNFFHEVNVLPQYFNKSQKSVFVQLSKDASLFYWFFIRQGICAPNKCSKTDIENIANKRKKSNFY